MRTPSSSPETAQQSKVIQLCLLITLALSGCLKDNGRDFNNAEIPASSEFPCDKAKAEARKHLADTNPPEACSSAKEAVKIAESINSECLDAMIPNSESDGLIRKLITIGRTECPVLFK